MVRTPPPSRPPPAVRLVINAGAGDDFLNLVDVGGSTDTTLNGDAGNDFFRVEGDNLESTTNTSIVGGSPNIPNPGDELLFDPNGQSFTIYDGAGNPTGTTTTPGGGLQVTNRGLVEYDELENVQIEGAPIITFDPAQLTIAEGDTLQLDAIIDFVGQAQIGDIEWDLDNDGLFAEPEEVSGVSQLLTWDQLLISAGIQDDGLYTIAVRATNSVATTTRYRTLTVINTPPTITPPSEATAITGEPFLLSLSVTDPGDDLVTGWEIDWSDGSDLQVLGASATSATHTFTADGAYTVLIRVFDEDSGNDAAHVITHTVTVGITEVPNTGPYTINEGESLTLSASPYGSPVAIGWDLNGGGVDLAAAVGTFTWAQLQSLVGSPINNSGTYSIAAIATYDDGNWRHLRC